MHSQNRARNLMALSLVATSYALPAHADVIVSGNDNHTVMVDGVLSPAKKVAPDTLMLIDVSQKEPKVIATVDVPLSVLGPPMAVAVSHGAKLAVVASATKIDDSGKIAPDNRVTLVDLTISPPKILCQTTAGFGATSAAFSPDNRFVVVTNRNDGTLTLFAVNGEKLDNIGNLDLGNPKSNPNGARFLADGKTVLVTRDGDHMVSVVHLDGPKMTLDARPMSTGVRPYGLDISADGSLAVISNQGRQEGDIDTVSVIDLASKPFRTVDTTCVGLTPEGVRFSPDGKFVAVACQNGSQKSTSHPAYHDHGVLLVYSIKDKHLHKVSEAPIGKWSQGMAFSQDGRMLLVQNMGDRDLSVFHFSHGKLTASNPLSVDGGPAAIAPAW